MDEDNRDASFKVFEKYSSSNAMVEAFYTKVVLPRLKKIKGGGDIEIEVEEDGDVKIEMPIEVLAQHIDSNADWSGGFDNGMVSKWRGGDPPDVEWEDITKNINSKNLYTINTILKTGSAVNKKQLLLFKHTAKRIDKTKQTEILLGKIKENEKITEALETAYNETYRIVLWGNLLGSLESGLEEAGWEYRRSDGLVETRISLEKNGIGAMIVVAKNDISALFSGADPVFNVYVDDDQGIEEWWGNDWEYQIFNKQLEPLLKKV